LLGLLLAAAEEVRDVRVLLGLRDVELLAAVAGDDARERDLRPRRRERHRVGPALLVLRERRVALDRLGAAPIDLAEAGIGERLGDLAHAIRPEVEGDDAVAGPDRRLVADRRRGDELVG